MSDLISKYMLEQNREMHETQNYGASGWRHVEEVLAMALAQGPGSSILDYGCGQGTLAKTLRDMGYDGDIREYDPCIPGKETLPEPATIVVCTDVMEHVEEDKVPAVLAHLKRLTAGVCFISVAIRKANKKLPDGQNAHITLKKPKWWINKAKKTGWRELYSKSYEKHDEPYEVRLWLR